VKEYMNKAEIRKSILQYLKQYNLNYRLINDSNQVRRLSDLDTIYLYYNVQVPGGIESDIRLYEERMQIRAYYSPTVCEMCDDEEKEINLHRIINYINANVYFEGLYTPRLYYSTDDNSDIVITTVIPYDFFELAPIETMEYITGYYPEFLEKFAVPIILLLLDEMRYEEAAGYIRKEILQ